MSEENKIRDAADAVAGVLEKVPIYEDALQPAAKEVGQNLETVAKLLRIALAPVKAMVWGYDQIEQFINIEVTKQLQNVPEERLQTPDLQIAGPAIESLRYTGEKSELRDLYASLLATSIDSETARFAHPSFIDAIKGISPDEAKLLEHIARQSRIPVVDVQLWSITNGEKGFVTVIPNFSRIGRDIQCEYPELTSAYVENLRRLGFIRIPHDIWLSDEKKYETLENDTDLVEYRNWEDEEDDREVKFQRKIAEITTYGTQFAAACIVDHDQHLQQIHKEKKV